MKVQATGRRPWLVKQLWLILLATSLVAGSAWAVADDGSADQGGADHDWESRVRAGIDGSLGAATQGQLQVTEVRETPMQGVYEVIMNSGEILFSDVDGQYLLAGEMYMARAEGLVNLTADTRKGQTARMIADLDAGQMIMFEPDNPRATITVFTDVDCTYCRRLHHDLELINAGGIAVGYAVYTRGVVSATSYNKMVSVWCAPSLLRAITHAKHGQNLPTRDC